MTRQQVLDQYFMDARHKLIDLAAFLDRVDRSEGDADWLRLSVPVLSNAVAFQTLTVTTSGTFRIRAGDTVSAEYPLVAYVPPEIGKTTMFSPIIKASLTAVLGSGLVLVS